MSSIYIALIADATASRALPPSRRARLQHALRRALPEFNRRWRTALAARFALTLGDEVQALLTTADPVWAITHEVRFRFPDVEWVVACGRGTIATRLQRGTTAPPPRFARFGAPAGPVRRLLPPPFLALAPAPAPNRPAAPARSPRLRCRPAQGRSQRRLAPRPPHGLAPRRGRR